jgi:hypothetical protein
MYFWQNLWTSDVAYSIVENICHKTSWQNQLFSNWPVGQIRVSSCQKKFGFIFQFNKYVNTFSETTILLLHLKTAEEWVLDIFGS